MEKELLGSIELNRIYQIDCLEGMRLIPTKSIDMILCDLPYGVTGSRTSWDRQLPLDELWNEYKRIIKDDAAIVLTATNPFASLLIQSNPSMFKYDWVWEKDQGSNFATVKHQPFRVHELVLVFSNGKITYTPRGGHMKYNPQMASGNPYKRIDKSERMSSVLVNKKGYSRVDSASPDGSRYPRSVQKFNREMGLHPTQKPLTLFEYLINTYTNEGDVVLDNCIGSGTTATAALKNKRKFIGFETDCKFFNIATTRIEIVYNEIKSSVSRKEGEKDDEFHGC